jgi:uncharacterized protein with von Willebrand factor type A (vWA) domain
MASPKQYKNVYTILEKVKKGEIQSYYTNNESLFGKVDFYKKPDLIKPYMHYIDERKVDTVVDTYIQNQDAIADAYRKLSTSAKINPDQKPDLNTFAEKVKENYRKFPKHMSKDIHKLFYHKMEKLEFEDRADSNYTIFKMLERANNPVAKIMTEGSNLKSTIFARNIMAYFALRSAMMEYIDPETQQQFMSGMNGEGNPDDIDQAMDKMFNDKQSKNMLDQALKDATDTCKGLDESIDKETQEKMFDNVNKDGGRQAGNLSPDYIRKVIQELSKLNLSMGSLKDKIKKLMDKSASYFSAKKETIYEDLFNSDNLGGLDDYIELHPKLRKIFAEDILVKDEKSIGKVDIYIDISGSMSDNCGVKDAHGNRISKLDFCKAFTVKLSEMGMLNEVYLFNNSVTKFKNDPISLAMLDTSGGTTTDRAINSIEKNGVNAIVITDAEDTCREYSDKAFFIGVKGSRFSHFHHEIIQQYSDNNQVVVFDGTKVYNVDRRGNTIGLA